MTLRQYLLLMSLGTFICWGIVAFIIFTLDPAQAGTLGLIFFYASLFLALLGTFSVIVFLLRRLIVQDNEIIFRHVKNTFRQGVLFSALAVLALLLLQWRLLHWWNGILLIILFVILEVIIFSQRRYQNKDYYV